MSDHLLNSRSTKLYRVSEEMAAFCSVPAETLMTTVEIFESVLKYVKENGLQDEVDGRIILADEKLRKLLGD